MYCITVLTQITQKKPHMLIVIKHILHLAPKVYLYNVIGEHFRTIPHYIDFPPYIDYLIENFT